MRPSMRVNAPKPAEAPARAMPLRARNGSSRKGPRR